MSENSGLYSGHHVEDMILTLRGQKVILDSDLARIYGVPTRKTALSGPTAVAVHDDADIARNCGGGRLLRSIREHVGSHRESGLQTVRISFSLAAIYRRHRQSARESARSFDVPRVVFASSKSAYAAFEGPQGAPAYEPVRETYRSIPTSVYGITKLAAEHLGTYYRAHLDVDFIALRFASTYGPFKRGAGIAPAGLIAAAIEGQSLSAALHRDRVHGSPRRLVYNRDIGRAIQLACAVEATRDCVFNIGTGVGSSVSEVVDAISAVEGAVAPVLSRSSQSRASPGTRDRAVPGCGPPPASAPHATSGACSSLGESSGHPLWHAASWMGSRGRALTTVRRWPSFKMRARAVRAPEQP